MLKDVVFEAINVTTSKKYKVILIWIILIPRHEVILNMILKQLFQIAQHKTLRCCKFDELCVFHENARVFIQWLL